MQTSFSRLTCASIVLLALGSLAVLWEASSPMGVNGIYVLAGYAAPIWWCARLAAFGFCSWRARRNEPTRPARSGWVWAVEPLLLVSVFWLCHQNLPLKLRFHASRPALERYVSSAKARPDRDLSPARVGLYSIKEARTLPPNAWQLTTDTWSVICTDRFGFAYCPDGPPMAEGYEHLEGHWYLWFELG